MKAKAKYASDSAYHSFSPRAFGAVVLGRDQLGLEIGGQQQAVTVLRLVLDGFAPSGNLPLRYAGSLLGLIGRKLCAVWHSFWASIGANIPTPPLDKLGLILDLDIGPLPGASFATVR